MKPYNLFLAALLSGSLLAGCSDLLSDEDKEALQKTFSEEFSEFSDEDNQKTSSSQARDEDYLSTTDVTVADTTGTARVAGEVALSELDTDTAQGNAIRVNNSLSSRAMLGRTATPPETADFTVSFINGSGDITELVAGTYTVKINPTLTAGGDQQYIVEGLGDGVNYIVAVKVTVNGDVIDLKSVAFIAPGEAKSEKAVIDAISTVVAQVVEEKVASGYFSTGGDKFSPQYINDLNETMTIIVDELIENNPDITLATFEVAIESDGGIKNLVSKLLTNEDVTAALDTLQDAAIEEQFEAPTELSDNVVARDYIANLFDELFGGGGDGPEEGGGAPKLFVDFFGDKFFEGAANDKTIAQVFDAIEAGFTPPEGGASTFTTRTATLTAFKAAFADIYAKIAQIDAFEAQGDSISDQEKTTLVSIRENLDFPKILLAVFPPAGAAEVAAYTEATTFNVPQAITLIFYVLKGGEGEGDDGGEGGHFNEMALLDLYGFDPTTDGALYGGVEINWLGIHPGSMWIEGTGEVDVLNAFTCVDNFLGGDSFAVSGVDLTYPTSAGGTATIALVDQSTYPQDPNNNGEGGGDSSCWVWDTWQEQRLLEEDGTYGSNQDRTPEQWAAMAQYLLDNGKIISDFASGDYVVTARYTEDGVADTETRTFNKKIITGLQQLNPRLTTPASEPRWPEGNVSQAEWDAFYVAQNAFTMTTFPVGAIGTIQWDAPAGLATSVPEGVIAAYNMDIGRHTCTGEGQSQSCDWQGIYSTWEDNTQIFDTQFELPGHVKDMLTENTDVHSPYELHLGINFLDAQTGEYLGNGGHSNGRFLVGAAVLGTDTFTISGTASNVPASDFTDSAGTVYPASAYQIAMIEEICNDTGCTSTTVLSSDIASDGSYTLTPTFDQAKGSAGSWVNIVMYIDADGDGTFDQGTEANNFNGEPQFWAENHVNFNTWGGILRIGSSNCDHTTGMCDYKEEAAVPGGTYDGPDFDTQPMDAAGATAP